MSGWMEQWLLGVACASMVMVVSGALVKGGSGQRVCKLVGSLLLLLVLLITGVVKLHHIEKAADFLQKNRRKLKLEEDDVECFRQHSQTQGRNTNYLVQSCPYNPVRARDLE